MKTYKFTDGNHGINGIEKADPGMDFLSRHKTILDALLSMTGPILYQVKPVGMRERNMGYLSSRGLRYVKKFPEVDDSILLDLAIEVANDVKSFWPSENQTAQEAMANAPDRFMEDYYNARKGALIFHSACAYHTATQKTKKRTALQTLTLTLNHALQAWVAMSLNSRFEAKERYEEKLINIFIGNTK